jgi:flagellar protein FlaJ
MRIDTNLSPKMKKISYLISAAAGICIIIYGALTYPLNDYIFHAIASLGIATGLTALAIITHLEYRRRKLIDNALPTLLEHLAHGQQAGMTLFQALEDASIRKYGPITDELKHLVAQLSLGVSLENAFTNFTKRIGTELALHVNVLILESVRLGGDLGKIFRSTASFVKELIRLRDERESQLRSYILIVYISSFIFLALVIVLYQSFFMPMANSQTQFFNLSISPGDYKALLLDLSIAEGFFGGLVAGKLSEGVTLSGLKHSVILITLVTIIFVTFI